MVVPGVSGSMMLMLLGYYDTIIETINDFIDALIAFNLNEVLRVFGILAPFGIGIVIGIFAIAKLIEFIFKKAEIHAYYGIIGLILCISNCNSYENGLEPVLYSIISNRYHNIYWRLVYCQQIRRKRITQYNSVGDTVPSTNAHRIPYFMLHLLLFTSFSVH